MDKYAIRGIDTEEKLLKVINILEPECDEEINQDEIDEAFKEGDIYLFPDSRGVYYYWNSDVDKVAFNLCTKISYKDFMLSKTGFEKID